MGSPRFALRLVAVDNHGGIPKATVSPRRSAVGTRLSFGSPEPPLDPPNAGVRPQLDPFGTAPHVIPTRQRAFGLPILTTDLDIVAGKWKDRRYGTYRGIRKGKSSGGVAFGDKGILTSYQVEGNNSYHNLLVEIVKFFKTGKSPRLHSGDAGGGGLHAGGRREQGAEGRRSQIVRA